MSTRVGIPHMAPEIRNTGRSIIVNSKSEPEFAAASLYAEFFLVFVLFFELASGLGWGGFCASAGMPKSNVMRKRVSLNIGVLTLDNFVILLRARKVVWAKVYLYTIAKVDEQL